MWLTRFQDRSSVSTKTKFGRERSWAGGRGHPVGGGRGRAAGHDSKDGGEEAGYGYAESSTLMN